MGDEYTIKKSNTNLKDYRYKVDIWTIKVTDDFRICAFMKEQNLLSTSQYSTFYIVELLMEYVLRSQG